MNYYATARTNYFHVTDVEKFKELTKGLSAEDVSIVNDDKDPTLYAILFDGSADWYEPISMFDDFQSTLDSMKNDTGSIDLFDKNDKPINIADVDEYDQIYDKDGDLIFDRWDNDGNWDEFTKELIKIIPEDECFVYMESGYEGHRYIVGFAQVVTHNGSKSVDLGSFVEQSVKELLGDNATTKYTY